ncbi:MAG: hypothetical protein WC511_06720 [Candidatus Pacearchaeota archaeon]|jgi:hypothetical protein
MSKYKKYLIIDSANNDTVTYGVKDIITDDVPTFNKVGDLWKGNKLATYDFIQQRLKSISGRVLTIVDASIPEGKQNKCVKDLIRKEFVDEFISLSEMMIDLGEVEMSEVSVPICNKDILGS